jgi:hypothetical protein
LNFFQFALGSIYSSFSSSYKKGNCTNVHENDWSFSNGDDLEFLAKNEDLQGFLNVDHTTNLEQLLLQGKPTIPELHLQVLIEALGVVFLSSSFYQSYPIFLFHVWFQ